MAEKQDIVWQLRKADWHGTPWHKTAADAAAEIERLRSRPDWQELMKDCGGTPADSQELVAVTRESLRLGLSAIKDVTAREAYHNYMAAWREIEDALSNTWPAGNPLHEALEDARKDTVVAIAFLARDLGTDRQDATLDWLQKGLMQLHEKLVAALGTATLSALKSPAMSRNLIQSTEVKG